MMEQCSPKIFIFTALECEAKALVNKFKLKKENIRHPFSIYRGDKIVLTVTGVGKVAMAAGVAYTSAVFPGLESPVMINIGIAGHKTQSVGRLLMASKIVDVDSEKVFYPQLVGANWPETSEIKTMALPSTKYYLDCLNDMEASAFYETAVRFSSCELIHCIKVVSDNGESSIESINSKVVVKWIDNQNIEIEKIVNRLEQMRLSIAISELGEYDEIINKWHFTVSGGIRLKSLLRRWNVLSSNNWLDENDTVFSHGKDVLRKLDADIACLDVKLK